MNHKSSLLILLLFLIGIFNTITAANSKYGIKSDSIFSKGVEQYNSKQYAEALKSFSECQIIDSINNNSTNYDISWIAQCYKSLGDTAKAKLIAPDLWAFGTVNLRLTVVSDSISYIADKYSKEGNWQKTLECLEQVAQIESNNIGKNNASYANTLAFISYTYSKLGNINEALNYQLKSNEIFQRESIGPNHLLALSLWHTYMLYITKGDSINALNYARKASIIALRANCNNKDLFEIQRYVGNDMTSWADSYSDDMRKMGCYSNGLFLLSTLTQSDSDLEVEIIDIFNKANNILHKYSIIEMLDTLRLQKLTTLLATNLAEVESLPNLNKLNVASVISLYSQLNKLLNNSAKQKESHDVIASFEESAKDDIKKAKFKFYRAFTLNSKNEKRQMLLQSDALYTYKDNWKLKQVLGISNLLDISGFLPARR